MIGKKEKTKHLYEINATMIQVSPAKTYKKQQSPTMSSVLSVFGYHSQTHSSNHLSHMQHGSKRFSMKYALFSHKTHANV